MPKGKPLDTGILSAALEGLELRKQRLEQQIAEVHRLLGDRGQKSVTLGAKPRRRLSVAARKRIAIAQKKRWAEFRKRKAATAKK